MSTQHIESWMFDLSQLFLWPVLLSICLLFAYAFMTLGAFLRQGWQRWRQAPAGFELWGQHHRQPHLELSTLESMAWRRLDIVRLVARVAPMLGLVATMIPMGPALKAMADGRMADVANSLMMAFAAVILALLAAAITYTVAQVRRRWYAAELQALSVRSVPEWAQAAQEVVCA